MTDVVGRIQRFVEQWGDRRLPVRWSVRDVLTYAIATGADAHTARSLVWESDPAFAPLPTFVTRFAQPAVAALAAATMDDGVVSFARTTGVRVHRTLPAESGASAEAEASTTTRFALTEHTSDRAVVTLTAETTYDGAVLAESTLAVHYVLTPRAPREGVRRSARGADPAPPSTVVANVAVEPSQAAVFRTLLDLRAGRDAQDGMHLDPASARALGLAAPVLPGEVTAGIVARTALERDVVAGGELVGLDLTYRAPVLDRDTLTLGFSRAAADRIDVSVTNAEGRVAAAGSLLYRPRGENVS